MGEGGQGGITWLLADGSAVLYGRDISSLLLNALAQAVTTKSSLPNGFVSIGMTTAATWAKSTCSAETTTTVEVFHGSQASRYARVLSEPPGIRWDDGDATFLVTTMPPSADSPRPPIRQATIAEWNALLDTR
jgi:hypothetical protein